MGAFAKKIRKQRGENIPNFDKKHKQRIAATFDALHANLKDAVKNAETDEEINKLYRQYWKNVKKLEKNSKRI